MHVATKEISKFYYTLYFLVGSHHKLITISWRNPRAEMEIMHHIQPYLLVLTADPVSFSFLSAAIIAAIVLSET